MSNLKDLVWNSDSALSAIHRYEIKTVESGDAFAKAIGGKYHVEKIRLQTQKKETVTGFSSDKQAREWCFAHYCLKMQPYVKPMPTKVYELSFDYEDGYFTVFMTTDKQSALDFIESVKKHDEQFICDTNYDVYEVEIAHDLYNDNHPLAPYKDKILNSVYEDSFSEWASNYVGESFASQLSIIEHELLTRKQGE